MKHMVECDCLIFQAGVKYMVLAEKVTQYPKIIYFDEQEAVVCTLTLQNIFVV